MVEEVRGDRRHLADSFGLWPRGHQKDIRRPDAVGGTSRKYRTPAIWKYGDLEFHFGPKNTDVLNLIYSETPDGIVEVIFRDGLYDAR